MQGKGCVRTLPERPVVVPSSLMIVPYFTTILTFRNFMSWVTPYTFLRVWLPLAHDLSVGFILSHGSALFFLSEWSSLLSELIPVYSPHCKQRSGCFQSGVSMNGPAANVADMPHGLGECFPKAHGWQSVELLGVGETVEMSLLGRG